jgi:hypothetical protein
VKSSTSSFRNPIAVGRAWEPGSASDAAEACGCERLSSWLLPKPAIALWRIECGLVPPGAILNPPTTWKASWQYALSDWDALGGSDVVAGNLLIVKMSPVRSHDCACM